MSSARSGRRSIFVTATASGARWATPGSVGALVPADRAAVEVGGHRSLEKRPEPGSVGDGAFIARPISRTRVGGPLRGSGSWLFGLHGPMIATIRPARRLRSAAMSARAPFLRHGAPSPPSRRPSALFAGCGGDDESTGSTAAEGDARRSRRRRRSTRPPRARRRGAHGERGRLRHELRQLHGHLRRPSAPKTAASFAVPRRGGRLRRHRLPPRSPAASWSRAAIRWGPIPSRSAPAARATRRPSRPRAPRLHRGHRRDGQDGRRAARALGQPVLRRHRRPTPASRPTTRSSARSPRASTWSRRSRRSASRAPTARRSTPVVIDSATPGDG